MISEFSAAQDFFFRLLSSKLSCHFTTRNTVKKMKVSMFSVFFVLCCLGMAVQARLAGECAMLCNDLRLDVLNMEICRFVDLLAI